MRRTRIALFALTVLCAASVSSAAASANPRRAVFALSSTAFADGGLIPKVHDCASSGDGDPESRRRWPGPELPGRASSSTRAAETAIGAATVATALLRGTS
ncbi:hypothetical protein [Amycolatopsis echigonensis]|uniref:Secreted protein n=1 Tax=Amycolatopsis echigonensis TaxID=2576905 RepID=A0A8E2AZ26_9PSEU|nr:hypothetical protein [Amycolatopsis echigonensis]MBB2498599.1 hypothetical protein [Amycolatopsis echigonensis]